MKKVHKQTSKLSIKKFQIAEISNQRSIFGGQNDDDGTDIGTQEMQVMPVI